MKSLPLTIFTCLFFIASNAQYSRIVVQLKDKANNSFSIGNPSLFLSKRAIDRRVRYNILIDSTDLPVTSRYLDSIRSAGNLKIISTSKWLNQVLIQTTDVTAITKINSLPFVTSSNTVAPRQISRTQTKKFKEDISTLLNAKPFKVEGNVYDYGNNFNQVHLHEGEYLHNKNLKGENIQIAVLDAGFSQYKTITAFDSIRQRGQVLGERDFVDFDNSVNEDDIHGMYCLSTMSANWPGKMVGTAPNARYWLIRTENATSEYPVEEFNWVVGAEFADSTGSDMISSSLGYYDFDDPAFNHTYNDIYNRSATVTKGAIIAARKGMIVMNSAGNAGGSWWRYIGFPADADSVCSVGATNVLGEIAGFSSIGYPGKIKPNIVSVGAATVIATNGNVPGTGNGTSFSNPNVAGLIACLWQAFPQFNNMKILDAVYRSADKYTKPDSAYGFGIPNFRIAFELLQKDAIGVSFTNEWMIPVPNPFQNNLAVYINAPETGKVQLRLVDAAGKLVEVIYFEAVIGQPRKIEFTKTKSLPGGVYAIQYISNTQKRVKRVVKQ